MSKLRLTALLLATVVVACLGGALATLSLSVPAGASTSAKALLTASLAAADKESSVHYVVYSSAGSHSIVLTASASADQGTQSIVVRADKKTGHVNGRLVGGNVYFEGDSFGLSEYLGMPASLAPKYAGKWIVFTSKDASFSKVAEAFQLTTALSQISIRAPLSIGSHTTIDGTKAVNVNGVTSSLSSKGKSGPATLAVATGKAPLPVRFRGRGSQSLGKAFGQVNFSDWGQTFSVTAPSSAIPATSITG